MWSDFSSHPGERTVTWLLRCWDNGASSLELEGREAKQLGSLTREGGIDKAMVYRGYAPWGSLWFYLCDHGENMKWDRKSTSIQEAQVRELRGKTITKGDSVRKKATPVSSGQLSRPGRQFDIASDPLEATSKSFLQEVSHSLTRIRGALPPARWRKGTTAFIGQCGFGGLARQIHKSIKL